MGDVAVIEHARQGAVAWNIWRQEDKSSHRRLDLSGADLHGAALGGANLSHVDLTNADLSGADLAGANLSNADLTRANLTRANLSRADLSLSKLTNAKLVETDLGAANLTKCDFQGANVTGALMNETVLADLDLSPAMGLEACIHSGPSTIDHRTLAKSPLPLIFLRGVGVPDALIEYLPSLFWQNRKGYSCFVSYSARDEEFARLVHTDLQSAGVRCWFAPEDMQVGAPIFDTLSEAIRLRDRVLLVFSENSVASKWVKAEVTKALEEERERGQIVLFPVRIDDAVLETNEAWAVRLRGSRNIADFRHWRDQSTYKRAMSRLVRDLAVDASVEAAGR